MEGSLFFQSLKASPLSPTTPSTSVELHLTQRSTTQRARRELQGRPPHQQGGLGVRQQDCFRLPQEPPPHLGEQF